MSIRFCVKVYNTSDFCWYWLSTKLHWTKTSSAASRNGIFSPFLFCLLTLFLTVCYCHVTYAFQSEFTLHSCLNVKKLLARSKPKIWSLSDCNWTRTQNHLALKQPYGWLSIWPNCPNNWALLGVLICTVHLTVCSCHFTYVFHSELTLYSLFCELNGAGFESRYSHLAFFSYKIISVFQAFKNSSWYPS